MSFEVTVTPSVYNVDVEINQTTPPFQVDVNVSSGIPYTGATDDVDLGDHQLKADAIEFDQTPVALDGVARLKWNPEAGTLDLGMGFDSVIQQVGMETFYPPVKNQTGSLIPNGTAVMAVGTLGASGRILIAPAVADGSVPSRFMLGITTHDIADGQDGVVTWFGLVRQFNTVALAPSGETWEDGDVLWIDPSVAGGLTNVEPSAPNIKVSIALVIHATTNGTIMVRPSLGMRLTDLHDVNAFSPSTNDLIGYNGTKWEAKSLSDLNLVTGSISSGQVAFGTGADEIGGDSGLVWDNTNKRLVVTSSSTSSAPMVRFISNASTNLGGVTIEAPNVVGAWDVLSISTKGISGLTVDGNRMTTIKSGNSANFQTALNVPFGKVVFESEVASGGGQLLLVKNNASSGTVLKIDTGSFFGTGWTLLNVSRNNSTQFSIIAGGNTIVNTGNLLVGTTTDSGNKLDVNGTARVRTISDGDGYMLTKSATGVITSSSSLYQSGSNVLIGTTTDNGFKLDVNGTARVQGQLTVGNGTDASFLINSAIFAGGSNTKRIIFKPSSENVTSEINLRPNGTSTDLPSFSVVSTQDSALGSNVMFFGRGSTTLPSTGVSYIGNFIWQNIFANSFHLGFLVSNTSLGRFEAMRMFNSGNVLIQSGGTYTDSGYKLDVNGTARVRTISDGDGYMLTKSATGVITSSSSLYQSGGNVLIGTTTDAGYKLDVNGTSRVQGDFRLIGGKSIDSTTGVLTIKPNADTILNSISLTNAIKVWRDGTTGIIANSVNNAILVFSGGNATNDGGNFSLYGSANGNYINFRIGTSTALRIFSNTNIGIGTTTDEPSAILNVSSTTKGFLPPRQTEAQRTAIASPAVGLIVYQTDATEGLYVYKSSGWTFIA